MKALLCFALGYATCVISGVLDDSERHTESFVVAFVGGALAGLVNIYIDG